MKKIGIFILLLFNFYCLSAQNSYTLSGYVKDSKNGEGLIGASVYVQEIKTGVQTNDYGFYSITLPKGDYSLIISYIGYQKIQKNIVLNTNKNLNLELNDDTKVLEEITISSKKADENVKNIEMSVNKIDIKTIQKMPALLGEVDIIKSIQLLPGVTSVGEGSSGFNVRGGTIDQNLILLDEAPVYNSSHLFGFFSVFNPDAVKDVKLLKGGIPSVYGGRVSSILDVRMKEGNTKKTQFSGGIGTIFTRLTLESPIVKDKGSFIVALRRSYIDILAKPFLNKDLRSSKFYFYDFTAKANYKLNDKNTIFLSGYFGRDTFGADFGFDWGNSTASLRWNHIFNNKLFLNNTIFYSNYDYSLQSDLKQKNTQDAFRWKSNIVNYSIKPDFTYYPNTRHTISFGGQSTYYTFNPGQAEAISGGISRSIGLPDKFALENSLYVSDEYKVNDALSLQYGLRYSNYSYLGPGNKLTLTNTNNLGERKDVNQVISYSKGKSIQNYNNLEPRFAANFSITDKSSVKLSYNRLAQYLHLLSNTTASSPLDVWTPSTNNIKPQIADQVAIGYFNNISDNLLETSVELYYKALKNQIDYVRNADLLLNPTFEADLLFGKGRAYGAEFFIKKPKGAFNGWISYTLARSERLIEGINGNQWFPSKIDKTHNLTLVGIYDLNKKWSFSTNFILSSGTPASFPTNKYNWQGFVIPHDVLDSRNTYRIPAYHRLDIAATKKTQHAFFKKGEGEIVFSIYNLYNRRNPFSVYVRQNEKNYLQTEAVQYAVFGSIIPAVTYNFKF